MAAQDDLDRTLTRLSASAFRCRFHLNLNDRTYFDNKGTAEIIKHARSFIAERLAPAQPHNDGQQTPMRGHPVFVAQHATATCCRGCLAKWHGIAAGYPMTQPEQDFAVALIARWLARESNRPMPSPSTSTRSRTARRTASSRSAEPANRDQRDLFTPPSDDDTSTS